MRNIAPEGMVKQQKMALFRGLTNHRVEESFVRNVIRGHELGDITEGISSVVTEGLEGLGCQKCCSRRKRTASAVICMCA